MDKQKAYSVSISKDLKCIGEGWDSEIWFEIKFGAYDKLNDTQMRIKRRQPRVLTLIAELIIAHKRMECGMKYVNSETHSMLVTSTYFKRDWLRIDSL